MDNERPRKKLVGIRRNSDHCLCGQPYCSCGFWGNVSHGSVSNLTSFDQRITTTELKKSKH